MTTLQTPFAKNQQTQRPSNPPAEKDVHTISLGQREYVHSQIIASFIVSLLPVAIAIQTSAEKTAIGRLKKKKHILLSSPPLEYLKLVPWALFLQIFPATPIWSLRHAVFSFVQLFSPHPHIPQNVTAQQGADLTQHLPCWSPRKSFAESSFRLQRDDRHLVVLLLLLWWAHGGYLRKNHFPLAVSSPLLPSPAGLRTSPSLPTKPQVFCMANYQLPILQTVHEIFTGKRRIQKLKAPPKTKTKSHEY